MDHQSTVHKLGHLFEDELLQAISRDGQPKQFKAGDDIVDIGQEIKYFPLVTTGSLKVMTENDEGQELLLYYLEMGDTCAMTLQCCLTKSKSKIRVVAEEDTEVILLPIHLMEEWIPAYRSWREFIFNSYHERLNEMLEAIDNLAFQNLEERLYKYLRDKAMINNSAELHTTHRQVAQELNTSRVVISRLMKKLEQQNRISSHRNTITVTEFLQ